jgi:hypothetical protein
VALHFIDDFDSKMAAMGATLESSTGADDWTGRNPSLRRELLRADKFLAGEKATRAAAAPVPNPPAQKK